MSAHELVPTVEVKGARKVIKYHCTDCDAKGKISAIPHATADGVFEVVRKGHAEDEAQARADAARVGRTACSWMP